MLEGLRAIDWERLECIVGSARSVPLILEDLASPDPHVSERACEAAREYLIEQEGITPASVEALPFLLELAATPTVLDRVALLRLVFDIGRDRSLVHWGFGPEPGEPVPEPAEVARQATERVRSQAARIEPLLSDGDASVRAHAALLVAFCMEPAPRWREALQRALGVEREEEVGRTILLAGGLASRDSPSAPPVQAAPNLPIAPGYLSASRVLVTSTTTDADRAAIEALVDEPAAHAKRFPWCEGVPPVVCAFALSAMVRGGVHDAGESLRRAFVRYASRGVEAGSYAWTALAQCALRATFAATRDRAQEERCADDLDGPQRSFLSEIVAHGWFHALEIHEHELLQEFGLTWGRGAARVLGLAPSGPLDEPLDVTGVQRPAWLWLRRVARSSVPFETVRDAIHAQKAPESVLPLALDAAAGSYALPGQSTVLGPRGVERLLELVEPVRERFRQEIATVAASEREWTLAEAALVAVLMVRNHLWGGPRPDERERDVVLRALPISGPAGHELLTAYPLDVRETLVLQVSVHALWAHEYMCDSPTPAVAKRSVEALAGGAYAAPERAVKILVDMRELGTARAIEEVLDRPDVRNRRVLEQALAAIRAAG
jgi:hypothetical protein